MKSFENSAGWFVLFLVLILPLQLEAEGKPDQRQVEASFTLPAGVRIQLVAAEPDIANPMSITVDEEGVLWVTEAHTYRWGPKESPFSPPSNPIKRIELGSDGGAKRTITAAEGFSEPVIGIAARKGQVYVTCLNELIVFDVAPDGRLVHRRLLVKDAAVPWNPFGFYRVHIGPDDKLWLAIADHPSGEPVTLTGSDGRRLRLNGKSGGLVRCNLDGSDLEIIVHGFRAPYAFDIDPWGHIWHISNGEGSPNIYVHVIPGLDYGYASRKVSQAWLAGQEPLAPPVRDMGAGANTAALHYYSSMFHEDWGSVFIANWGSHGPNPPNRDIHRWRRAEGDSTRIGSSDASLTLKDRWLSSSDPKFRPTGLALAPDGGLYLIDWHGKDDENDQEGRVLKISLTNKVSIGGPIVPASRSDPLSIGGASVPASRSDTLSHSRERDGVRGRFMGSGQAHGQRWNPEDKPSLGSKNHFIRDQAIRSLVQQGDDALPLLAELLDPKKPIAPHSGLESPPDPGTPSPPSGERDGVRERLMDEHDPSFTSAQVIWTLTRINTPAAAKTMALALKHPDPRTRAHALRQMRQAAGQKLGGANLGLLDPGKSSKAAVLTRSDLAELAAPLLSDPDAEVRVEAALAQQTDQRAVEGLIAALSVNPNSRLIYQIAIELSRRAQPRAIETLLASPDPDRRRVAAIALENSLHEKTPLAAALDQAAADPGKISNNPKSVRWGESPREPNKLVKSETTPEEILALPSAPLPAKIDAISALALAGQGSVDQWRSLLGNPSSTLAVAALRALRHGAPPPEVKTLLKEMAPNLSAREELHEELRLTLQMLDLSKEGPGTPSLQPQPKKEKADLTDGVLARLPAASPELGQLTFHSAKLGCSGCHLPREGQPRLGPELSEIGKAADARYLIESILDPSSTIKTGFEIETVETADGESYSGVVEVQEDSLRITKAPGEQVLVPRSKVQSRMRSRVSLMPEGLEAGMTEAELADLVAFLAGRK